MAEKRFIRQLTTSNFDFPSLIRSEKAKYADKWKGGKRPITLIGVHFSSRKRNIDIPVIAPL